ncbi:shikimate dehydrogenase family protein [Fulvivirga lutimaris]|uniref:shikimate dehydrogenase family protein n=1 Tax=Fulvivirga lutimaris TaxID=1819566 RepID=UPI0012BB973D|nr:shikimate dehydrogenase [Fulvivirga lutimaris]MTI40962.1 shikimate dehydrogenase [Fulvivirga lutimaris]
MKKFGLIGKKLSHSFSQAYFSKKFKELNLTAYTYDLYELPSIELIEKILADKELIGLNVTVPYKQDVIPYLDSLDQSAERIGAVNVIKVDDDGFKKGYNSDYYGFKQSLAQWLPEGLGIQALILGSGGASKAVKVALEDLNITYKIVSRSPGKNEIGYDELSEVFSQYQLIINTSPLGMSPDVHSSPNIPYELLNSNYYLYDLVYNPEITEFLKKGVDKGAQIKNGLEMLHLQAEESWAIWNSK